MIEMKDKDLSEINKKIGKLSVDMAKGNVKNAQELAKIIEGVLNPEELIFATTVLIIERYTKISNDYVVIKQKEKANDERMFG